MKSEQSVKNTMRISNRSVWAIAVSAAFCVLCGPSYGADAAKSDNGVASITSGAVRGLGGSGNRGLGGSGNRGLGGSGNRALAGSGTDGLGGSGNRGLGGSGNRGLGGSVSMGSVAALSEGFGGSGISGLGGSGIVSSVGGTGITRSIGSSTGAADVVVVGGLESVAQGRINVMGQEFDASGLGAEAMDLQPGQLVYVEAKKGEKRPVATAVRAYGDPVVPGATAVFVRGSVDSVDEGIGQAVVGSLRIDLNNVGGQPPTVGDVLNVSGTQPLPSGIILGDGSF